MNRPKENGVLAFHEGVEELLLNYVHQNAKSNDPLSVLQTIDEFCLTKHWMMHIGQEKAEVILDAIRESKKRHSEISFSHENHSHFVVVELGSYCGYSAVRIASELYPSRSQHLFCIEVNENCVNWTQRMVAFAGLEGRVTVIHSPVHNVDHWKSLIRSTLSLDHFKINILFIDHDKKQYFHDLKLIVDNDLLTSESTVIADNVLSFNSPKQDYLDYVRDINGPFKSSRCVEGFIEYCTKEERAENVEYLKDGIEISVFR